MAEGKSSNNGNSKRSKSSSKNQNNNSNNYSDKISNNSNKILSRVIRAFRAQPINNVLAVRLAQISVVCAILDLYQSMDNVVFRWSDLVSHASSTSSAKETVCVRMGSALAK